MDESQPSMISRLGRQLEGDWTTRLHRERDEAVNQSINVIRDCDGRVSRR